MEVTEEIGREPEAARLGEGLAEAREHLNWNYLSRTFSSVS